MKLRNKKTGEVKELETITLFEPKWQDCGESFDEFYSIAELNENWEDYTPPEPLIKDEKVRKAVRAWAEANEIKYIEPCARSNKDNYRIVGFNALGRSFTMELSNEFECRITMGQALSREKRGAYTITELCGEEEAPEPLEPTFIDMDERIKEKEEE